MSVKTVIMPYFSYGIIFKPFFELLKDACSITFNGMISGNKRIRKSYKDGEIRGKSRERVREGEYKNLPFLFSLSSFIFSSLFFSFPLLSSLHVYSLLYSSFLYSLSSPSSPLLSSVLFLFLNTNVRVYSSIQ